MPPKKCYRVNKGKISQMKTIKCRLIKIRMKIENYIYKEKTICKTQAKSFLDEISSYEPQCDGNVECLQVIEKLTKFMNIFISNKEAAVNDNNNNDDVNIVEPNKSLGDEIHYIPCTSPPVCQCAEENVRGNQNLFVNNKISFDKKNTEDLTNCNNKAIDTKLQVHGINSIQVSEVDLTRGEGINTNQILEIKSIGPLDSQKKVNYNLCTENSKINFDKSIDISIVPKPVVKVQEAAIVAEISQQLSDVELKNDDNLSKSNNGNKTCVEVSDGEKAVNSKSVLMPAQRQALQLMQVGPMKQFIPPTYPKIKESEMSSVNTDEAQTEIVQKKIKFNKIHIQDSSQNEIGMKNVIKENNGNKNFPDKSVINKTKAEQTNKRKTKKESEMNMKGKRIKKAENKKEKEYEEKRKVNKIKNSDKNIKDDKSAKVARKDNEIKLDLSWFDNIKSVRQVDETEYFIKKKYT